MEINLEKIKTFSATTIIHIIGGVLIPGFLFIFIFNRTIFFSVDLFRLSILSMSISFPILILNALIFIFQGILNAKKDYDAENFNHRFMVSAYLSSIISIPVFYIPILLGYIYQFSMKEGIFSLMIVEIITIFVVVSILPKNNG